MPEPVEVVVLGQPFTVSSDDGADHIRRVAADVDRQMRELAATGRIASSFTVAVVTALNIASEYQKLRAEHARMQEVIDRLTARLSAAIGG
jgi:cell division protein ZapA